MKIFRLPLAGTAGSVKSAWMVSYLAILILPILVALFVFSQSQGALEAQFNASNRTLLSLIGQQVDRQLEDANKVMLLISWNKHFANLTGQQAFGEGSFPIETSDLAADLRQFRSINDQLPPMYVFLPRFSKVLTENAIYDPELFFDSTFAPETIKEHDLSDYFLSRHRDEGLPVTVTDAGSRLRQAIAITRTIPANESEPIDANLIVLFDADAIFQSIQNLLNTTKTAILILDRQNRILASSGAVDPGDVPGIDWNEASRGISHQKLQSGDYSLFFHPTRNFGWRVLLLVPENVFNETLLYTQLFGLAGLLLAIGLGLAATVYLVRRNYLPLERLLGRVSDGAGAGPGQDRNEYRVLEQAISRAQAESRQARGWLEENRSLMKEHAIRRLLRDPLAGDLPLEEFSTAFGMDFGANPYLVLFITVENLAEFERGTGEMALGEQRDRLRYLLSRAVEAGFEGEATISDIEELGTYVNIISFKRTACPDLRARIEAVVDRLRRDHRLDCCAAYSQVHTGPQTLAIAFEEAYRGLEYRFVLGEARVIAHADLPELPTTSQAYYYPVSEEIRLMNALKAGDAPAAAEKLEAVLDRNLPLFTLAPERARCLAFDLAATMVKAILDLQPDSPELPTGLDPVRRISDIHGADGLRPELDRLLQEICQFSRKKSEASREHYKSQANSQLSSRIRQYIQDHAADLNLNISSIADEFRFSPTYVSRVFRENQDQGLLDYINTVRINRAKTSLKNRELTLQEVARANGFQDANAFIRVFKKVQGVTPGKYRDILD